MNETPVLYIIAIIIGSYMLAYRIGRISNRQHRICAIIGTSMIPIVAAIAMWVSITGGHWSESSYGFWGSLGMIFLMMSIPIFVIWAIMAIGFWAGRKL